MHKIPLSQGSETIFHFPDHMIVADPVISTLDSPLVLSKYLKGWKYWN